MKKMEDYSYYKKNSLLRHLISKELSSYHNSKQKEKDKKLNDFVIPILSFLITVIIWYYNRELKQTNALYLLRLIFIVLFGYISTYFILTKIVRLILNNVYNWFKKRLATNKKRYYETDFEYRIKKFNYDVVNQISLSYSLLVNSSEIDDIELKEYYQLESFFYLSDSLENLKRIFNIQNINELLSISTIKYSNNIHIYRLESSMKLMRKNLIALSNDELSKQNPLFYTDLKEKISLFNSLIKIFNPLDNFSVLEITIANNTYT